MDRFAHRLEERLKKGLPGWSAHRKLAPPNRGSGPDSPPADTRFASVLILLYPHRRQLHTGLILRPQYPGVHSGQVAFPGGKREAEDIDDIATALREAEEEVGIPRDLPRIVGSLSPVYIPPSRYWVSPVLATLSERPVFVPDNHEVERVLEMPLSALKLENSLLETEFLEGEKRFSSPAYHWNNHRIWGATAMMISELIELIELDSDLEL